jgi:hypothetical protein
MRSFSSVARLSADHFRQTGSLMTFIATCQRFGARRLRALASIKSREDWATKWPAAKHAYPFTWGECWKAVVEYGVKDYAAELGFYLDVLGMSVNATWDDHAMITSPDGEYAFTIYKAKATAREMNLQFMIGNIADAAAQLKRRKVTVVEDLAAPWGEQAPMRTFRLATPNRHVITLWGMVAAEAARKPAAAASEKRSVARREARGSRGRRS